MKLIVGLGNPGRTYANSRHNIGFLTIKALSALLKISLKKEKGISCLSGKAKISGTNVVLAMPLTFMNLSGEATGALVKRYKIELEDLLVVCDDLDLDYGRCKIRPNGSAGGHHGIESIIASVKSADFARLRIGIGRPHQNVDAAEYVLADFNRQEEKHLEDIISCACDCCCVWVSEGITKSMNIFNRRAKTQ